MKPKDDDQVICMECKHAFISEYNEWIDVYCMLNGQRKPVSLMDSCEKGEPR